MKVQKRVPYFIANRKYPSEVEEGRYMKLGFIGAGNMGGAILKGCVESGKFASRDIYVCDKDPERRKSWEELLLINTTEDVAIVVDTCDIIIVGIKPDGFSSLMPEISPKWKTNKILVSMAAGIPISFLEGFLPMGSKLIRIMPNTPAMVRQGMTAVSRNNNISNQDMEISMEIFSSVGLAEEVAEDLIDCVIGVSGSSPAYTYLYIEALVEAAIANGMEKNMATKFAAQSVLGAAKMVLETGVEPQQLCLNVCSPGGTTIEAVNKLKENGFKENVTEAFQAAVDKSKLLSKQREG